MIVIAHLCNGSVVIAKQKQVDEGFVLEDPVEILAMPNQNGVQVNLIPFGSLFGLVRPISEVDFCQLIADPVPAPSNLADRYTTMVTGIQLPEAGTSRGSLSLVKP